MSRSILSAIPMQGSSKKDFAYSGIFVLTYFRVECTMYHSQTGILTFFGGHHHVSSTAHTIYTAHVR